MTNCPAAELSVRLQLNVRRLKKQRTSAHEVVIFKNEGVPDGHPVRGHGRRAGQQSNLERPMPRSSQRATREVFVLEALCRDLSRTTYVSEIRRPIHQLCSRLSTLGLRATGMGQSNFSTWGSNASPPTASPSVLVALARAKRTTSCWRNTFWAGTKQSIAG